jgi:5-methylcytosine-specific restriction protein A
MAKITSEMVHASYKISKEIVSGELNQQDGLDILNSQFGMNKSSAAYYIQNYKCMMNGERYSNTMNLYATKYYLTSILLDNGKQQLETALESVRQHMDYQYKNVFNELEDIHILYRKYEELLENDCIDIITKIFELIN